MNAIKKAAVGYSAVCSTIHTKVASLAHRHANAFLLVFGICLVAAGLVNVSQAQLDTFSEAAYDSSLVRHAVGNLFALIEGAFGALIMVVAGLGAIVAAAMGAYRAAVGMLVVAVGAFILRSLVSLFFGADYDSLGVTRG